ncbi:esterase/lipase family protein [Thiorhodovibrio winogradskyi]|nr:alpha/beta fold hydrolase [Thiorhodovibrio winogradskyi]
MREPSFGLTLAFPFLTLIAAGCQSLPSPHGNRSMNDSQLGPALAESIDVIAHSGHRSDALTRAQVRHRHLLARHLPRLLAEAKAEGSDKADPSPDSNELDQIASVVDSGGSPDGLKRAGIGVPLVVRRAARDDPNAPRFGYHLAATLVAQPDEKPDHQRQVVGQTWPVGGATAKVPEEISGETTGEAAGCCQVDLVDPRRVARVPTTTGTLPVAMDLYAPIQATRATNVAPMAAVGNLLRPGRFTDEPRIIFLQPFDANKTPVVLVHGLLSTPWVWKPLVTELLGDPRIRDCCQFWFFYYPTGQPVPLSALQLRQALDDAVARTQLNRKMILIGHSMGGILSRVQVSRLEPARAEQVFPGVSELSADNRVRQALIFVPRADVSRVVFLFVPHRGSALASNGLGALAIRLIRLPDTLLKETEYAFGQLAGHQSQRLPTSIHGLSPRSAFMRALNTTTPSVPTHSIIGNRGRGDGSRGSDGVVPVRSARLPSASSELVVPTGHGGFGHPAAVDEIKRIILMDVAQGQTRNGADTHARALAAQLENSRIR